jgi:bifunctional UDP-N-acetylglucosamine pyrophosphorylase/glucosamine-1-phosphate N-acetyltransferase
VSAFHHPEARALVLAAGQGTRMHSDLAKVLHPMAGRPLLSYVLDAVSELGVERTLVVIGHQRERVRAAFAGAGVEWVEQVEQCGTAVTVLSMRLPDPKGYGRIVRGTGDEIRAIVEERDATPEQRRIDEVNSGVYAFDWPRLDAVLSRLTAHNAQGEYYLTDAVDALRRAGHVTTVVLARDHREVLGINTPQQLAEAEQIYAELRAGRRDRQG